MSKPGAFLIAHSQVETLSGHCYSQLGAKDAFRADLDASHCTSMHKSCFEPFSKEVFDPLAVLRTLVKEMDSRLNIVRGCAKQTETSEMKSDSTNVKK